MQIILNTHQNLNKTLVSLHENQTVNLSVNQKIRHFSSPQNEMQQDKP